MPPPPPRINGRPHRLKSNGKSHFWLKADNIAVGNSVEIRKITDGSLLFEGEVQKKHPTEPYWKLWVKALRTTVADGDIIGVTITITNGGVSGTGDPDEIIIDDGPDTIVDKKQAIRRTSKAVTKSPAKSVKKETPKKKSVKKKTPKKKSVKK